MDNLDSLYQWLQDKGVCLFDRQLPFSYDETKALTINLDESDTWGIFVDTGRMENRAEEHSALLHKAGHFATGTTHKVCSPYDLVEKHEYKANKWAIQRRLSADDLDKAVSEGYTDL